VCIFLTFTYVEKFIIIEILFTPVVTCKTFKQIVLFKLYAPVFKYFNWTNDSKYFIFQSISVRRHFIGRVNTLNILLFGGATVNICSDKAEWLVFLERLSYRNVYKLLRNKFNLSWCNHWTSCSVGITSITTTILNCNILWTNWILPFSLADYSKTIKF